MVEKTELALEKYLNHCKQTANRTMRITGVVGEGSEGNKQHITKN